MLLPSFSFSSFLRLGMQSGWWKVFQHSSLQLPKCELSWWYGSSCSQGTPEATWSACCLCNIKRIKATLVSHVSLRLLRCDSGSQQDFFLFNGRLISIVLRDSSALHLQPNKLENPYAVMRAYPLWVFCLSWFSGLISPVMLLLTWDRNSQPW